jgi:transposase
MSLLAGSRAVAWLETGTVSRIRSARRGEPLLIEEDIVFIIGIDPHKGSHTATAIDPAENELGQLRVRAAAGQVDRLLAWAEAWPERTWAVENAGGLGYLLSQQLLAAGERVLDVPPKLAARVRLLATGDINKNDPNDARSVAIAALRSPAVKPVCVEDHHAVMKVWVKRHRDLGRARTQLVCRLHAVLCELVPGGGISKELSVGKANKVLDGIEPKGAVASARYQLAEAFIDDLGRIDEQIRDTKKRISVIVTASKTTVTKIFGAGPVVAAMVKGDVGDVRRFASRDRFASYNGTAPIEVSSGPKKIYRLSRRGNRRMNHAIHMIAVTQLRFPGTEGRSYFERKLAEGKTGKEALRSLKRRISDLLYARLLDDARREDDARDSGPGGHTGNDSASSAAGSHPATPTLRKSHSRTATKPTASRRTPRATAPSVNRKISRRAS